MTSPKQSAQINFNQGVDTKTDPFQVALGKFLELENTVFYNGALQKRNGYADLPALIADASTLTTFNGDLTAIGPRLQALSQGTNGWVDRGYLLPMGVETLPLIRNNLNQIQVDAAVSSSGLVCTVYTDINNTTTGFYYAIADVATGQNVVAPTNIVQADGDYGTPRVFVLGGYFIVLFTNKTTGVYHLKYFAISIASPTTVTAPADVAAAYTPDTTVAFDAAVLNENLYIAWNSSAAGGIRVAYLTAQLSLSSSVNRDAAHVATMVSVTADMTNQVVWVSYYDSGTTNGYAVGLSPQMAVVTAVAKVIDTKVALNITSAAQSGTLTVFYEVSKNYSYDSSVPTHFIESVTRTQAGVTGAVAIAVRSIGLASKSFIVDGVIYFLGTYQSPYQNSYYLVNGSATERLTPKIVAQLAYQNGGGYLLYGLPGVTVTGSVAQVGYRFKDLIQAVNKNTAVPSGNQTAGIYSQTGLNLVSFDFSVDALSVEIGNNLNLTGGITWGYDGYAAVEQGFFLYPDSIKTGTSTTGGHLSDQDYYYQVTYEWTDNQGNAFRSAPSIPVKQSTSGGNLSTNTINVPTLRLTYKTANPVKIVIYRWSSAQPIYYQVTSITAPTLNILNDDQIAFSDTLADATILGNNILYTNGGVIENIGPPSFKGTFLFDDRLWGIPSEDPNLLWFSKQVIEATPVEMNDLFTMYIAPSLGSQGPSGPLECGFPMDDKAVLFKRSSISYFNGIGPDNTGANNQYSQPVLVTSTLGCSNQKSIVFLPQGLMFEFQSEAGNQIWLLGRNLSTQYIGAPVEGLTRDATVQSAVSIPGTNQVRFTMSTGITLVYDFYFGQWGTAVGVPALSSTLYQGLHSYIDQYGQARQETPGRYLDGSMPVLISFKTGWIGLAGLRGYERIHEFSFLGTYLSPHKLAIQVAYDYGSPDHQTIYTPDNFAGVYGDDSVYGGGATYGGPSNIESFRVFAKRQKCKAFQISVQEVFDPSKGVLAGAGLSLSGLNLVMKLKKGWAPVAASRSVG